MAVLRRVLIGLFGLIHLALGIILAVCMVKHSFGIAVVDFMDRFAVYNMELWFVENINLWEPFLLLLLFLILGLFMLFVAVFRHRESKSVRVEVGEGNAIEISKEAIGSVIRQAVSEIASVESASTNMRITRGRLMIVLQLVVPSHESIPAIGVAARDLVADRLRSVLSITAKAIRVEVANVVEKPQVPGLMEVNENGL